MSSKEKKVSEHLKWLSRALDSQFTLPGGFKVGWDALLGLIPGAGDLMTNALSFYILARAFVLGASPWVLMRMSGNILMDNVLDSVPFLGNILDIFWRANSRNLEILQSYLESPEQEKASSRRYIFGFFIAILGVTVSLTLVIMGLSLWGVLKCIEWLAL